MTATLANRLHKISRIWEGKYFVNKLKRDFALDALFEAATTFPQQGFY